MLNNFKICDKKGRRKCYKIKNIYIKKKKSLIWIEIGTNSTY